MSTESFRAAILDLDGVVTRTARLHARAWKEMFDDFFSRRSPRSGEDHRPFDLDADYLLHVDGKPRFDGVRDFLCSRGIALPEGDAGDSPEMETIRGLGNRKNDIFLELLGREKVKVFDDAVEQIRRWRRKGMRTALITSSRNGRRIVRAAELEELFEFIVDGHDAERLGLPGKPAPDIFLHAARRLGVEPREALVVEDAVSGVAAGRAGEFGLVVGVERGGEGGLREAGADLVVRDLREIERRLSAEGVTRSPPPHAMDQLPLLTRRLDRMRLALFLDYDGTLTPIVRRPEEAVLAEAMRALLRELARRVTVAIVSGRDLSDVRAMVGLDELYYAGSHGFDVIGPGDLRMQLESAVDHLPDLDRAERALGERIEEIPGAWVERKRFALAVHFREAHDGDAGRVEAVVNGVHAAEPRLRKKGGKKIFELQPDVPWDKGRAVRWLLERLGLDGDDVLPVYIGDDVTDEDAFRALPAHGLGIRLGEPEAPTAARYHLRDTADLQRFLSALLQQLPAPESRDET